MSRKDWTYEEALKIFPKVKQITEEFYYYVSELSRELEERILPENEQEEKEEEIKLSIQNWTKEILALEIDVKGVWLVDFDNGEGYYCWRLGEETILFEHNYEEGFAGRKLIKRNRQHGDNQ